MAQILITGQWVVEVPEEDQGREAEYVRIVSEWMENDPIGFLSALPTPQERFLAGPPTVSVLKHEWNRS